MEKLDPKTRKSQPTARTKGGIGNERADHCLDYSMEMKEATVV